MYKPPTKDVAYVYSNTLLVKLGIVPLKDINRANILCWYRHVSHKRKLHKLILDFK